MALEDVLERAIALRHLASSADEDLELRPHTLALL
jgi:hypothetical protein